MLRFPRNKMSGARTFGFREQEETLVEGRINGGMVTSIDAADLENNQFLSLENVYVRYDKTSRRFGRIAFTPASPDANRVLHITPYERFTGNVTIARFTPSTVKLASLTAWTSIVGVLTGTASDRFNTVVINDRMFFANNGADYIQEINQTAATFARLGNAPKYRYITGFNNRVIGANLAGASPNPVKIGWSGDLNFEEWDASVDFSAGSTPLLESPTDFADPISGVFGFTETALVLRARSLWGMSKQPSATDPFNFFVIAPSIGCDSPYSAVPIRNGICWFDYRTGSVYAYTVGMAEPTPIGRPVEKSIIPQVGRVSQIFASYNTIEEEYTLCLPVSTSNVVRMWTYNFRTQAWWYEEQTDLTTLASIDYSGGSKVINDLSGTINSLTGIINDLSVSGAAEPSRIYGYSDGTMSIQSNTADDDAGTNFTTKIISRTNQLPKRDGYITNLRIEYIPRLAGSFTAYYSKDAGLTWTVYKTVTFSAGDVGSRKLVTFRKHLKCTTYNWKIESTDGLFDLVEYEVQFVPAAESRSR